MKERADYHEIIENILYHPSLLPEDCSDISDSIEKNLNYAGYVIIEQTKITALTEENRRLRDSQENTVKMLKSVLDMLGRVMHL